MSETHDHVFTVYIRTDARDLWKALTTPDATVQWFHGLRLVSELRTGSSIAFHLEDDPDRRALAIGEVLDVRERESLLFGFRLANFDDPPTRVRWNVEPVGDDGRVCKLTVTHVGFVERNATWHQTAAGWPVALSSLKSLLETGHALRLGRALG
jgi:uncharacterized protein YndB with AHSA1/START domain